MGSVGASKSIANTEPKHGEVDTKTGLWFDFDKNESTFKEGKFSKTNGVPVNRRNGDGDYELKLADGYGTKLNGEVFYLQKIGGKWQVNYNGMLGGMPQRNLNAAKEELKRVAEMVAKIPKVDKQFQRAVLSALNVNGGRLTKEQMNDITKRLRARGAKGFI